MLRCHGELIAVPHAEGCTQWLLVVCRRAAYAVRLVLPFGLTLQQCCVVLLCVRKVRYPELGAGPLAVLDAIGLLLQCSQTYPAQTARPLAGPLVHICSSIKRELGSGDCGTSSVVSLPLLVC